MNAIVEWLKQYWFIFSALVAGGVAWGQTTMQVAELKDKVSRGESRIETTAEFKSRIDERTIIMQREQKEMQDEQKEQRQILMEILATQRAWAQRNNVVVKQQAPVKTTEAPK